MIERSSSPPPPKESGSGLLRCGLGCLIGLVLLVVALFFMPWPVWHRTMEVVRKTQAKNDAYSLVNAIKNFRAEYNHLPLHPHETADTVTKRSNATFMRILLAEENPDDDAPVLNPREIVYFSANPQPRPNGPGFDDQGNFHDPWGNLYHIALDGDNDGTIIDPFTGDPIHARVIAWSTGPHPDNPSPKYKTW